MTPEKVMSLAFQDELEKISGAFSKAFRAASPEKAHEMMSRMFRLRGLRPPRRAAEDLANPEVREQILKGIRSAKKVQLPEAVPRGSALWRKAMQDIKAGRMSTFESGLSSEQGKNILRTGPSTRGGFPLEENMPAVSEAFDDVYDRALDAGVDRRDAMKRITSGLYAADAGTSRTAEYAERAARRFGGVPAALRFELPHSMAQAGTDLEMRIPHQIFQRWARNPRVETVGGQLIQGRRKLPG